MLTPFRRSRAPRLGGGRLLPARDRRLEGILDPEEGPVDVVVDDPEHELDRLPRRIASGLLDPVNPLPESLPLVAEARRLVPDVGPHLRLHVTRMDHVRGHAGAGQVGGQVARELVEPGLRRRVRAAEGPGRVQRSCRGQVDDPSPAELDHVRGERATGQVWTDEVDLDRLHPPTGIRAGERLDRPEDARGVDEDLRRSELGLDLRLQALDLVEAGDVTAEALGGARNRGDACAPLGERLGDVLTEAARRARDHGDLAVEAHRAPGSRWKTSRSSLDSGAPLSSIAMYSSMIAPQRACTSVAQSRSQASASLISE